MTERKQIRPHTPPRPRPSEILCCRKYGDYTYIGLANGNVYVSSDNGETWYLRRNFGSHEVTSL